MLQDPWKDVGKKEKDNQHFTSGRSYRHKVQYWTHEPLMHQHSPSQLHTLCSNMDRLSKNGVQVPSENRGSQWFELTTLYILSAINTAASNWPTHTASVRTFTCVCGQTGHDHGQRWKTPPPPTMQLCMQKIEGKGKISTSFDRKVEYIHMTGQYKVIIQHEFQVEPCMCQIWKLPAEMILAAVTGVASTQFLTSEIIPQFLAR